MPTQSARRRPPAADTGADDSRHAVAGRGQPPLRPRRFQRRRTSASTSRRRPARTNGSGTGSVPASCRDRGAARCSSSSGSSSKPPCRVDFDAALRSSSPLGDQTTTCRCGSVAARRYRKDASAGCRRGPKSRARAAASRVLFERVVNEIKQRLAVDTLPSSARSKSPSS